MQMFFMPYVIFRLYYKSRARIYQINFQKIPNFLKLNLHSMHKEHHYFKEHFFYWNVFYVICRMRHSLHLSNVISVKCSTC